MVDRADERASWRCLLAVGLLSALFGLLAVPSRSQPATQDNTRKLWNKQFAAARVKPRRTKRRTNSAKRQKPSAASQSEVQPKAKSISHTLTALPIEAPVGAINDELIGITIWRLREARASDTNNTPRLLVQEKRLVAERVEADTTFRETDRVRLSIEVPRTLDHYLYVIDREVYTDGTMSDPYLIFPTMGTRNGNNVVTAGKIIDIPAPEDDIPLFNFTSFKRDRVSERLTIIVSPQPLAVALNDGPLQLSQSQVAQWEEQWGSRALERREARGGPSRGWTKAEKEAGEGKRLLTQRDPLPQSIYHVIPKQRGYLLVVVALQIRPDR